MKNYVVVLITVSSKSEATTIANRLLKEKLAACVNIIAGLESIFWWKGKIEQAFECLLLVKTRAPLVNKLIKTTRKLHSYDVPEIISLPIDSGNPQYLKWIHESTS
jgi:periplasmic divalent cation tolerance protein